MIFVYETILIDYPSDCANRCIKDIKSYAHSISRRKPGDMYVGNHSNYQQPQNRLQLRDHCKVHRRRCEENGKEVKFVYMKDMEMKPCEACNYCKANDSASRRWNFTLIDEIRNSYEVILTSPLYFGQTCAQYRIFEDRMYSALGPNGSNIPAGKKVTAVVTCGADIEAAQSEADHMNFVFQKYFAAEPVGSIVFKDSGDKDAASKDAEILDKAKDLGKKF